MGLDGRWARTALAAAPLLLGCPGREEGEPATPPAPEEQAAAAAVAPSGRPYSETREPCRERDALRNAYFGDMHVHTSLSMDANIWDVRATPDDAYRFARGEPIEFPGSQEPRKVQLERPLDFAALTDHAEFLGEVSLCTRPDSPVYASPNCATFRGEGAAASSPMGRIARLQGIRGAQGAGGGEESLDLLAGGRLPEVCGEDGALCVQETTSTWKAIQDAAERWYDRSADCRFTTLVAYEYTATPDATKVHHNVFFRNARVPALPITWVDKPVIWDLWTELQAQCLDAGTGCDVLTAPHNSNLSNGQMFVIDYKQLSSEEQTARARLRARLEPLVEISQIKGDSECRSGMYRVVGDPDEQCDYEQIRPAETEDCGEGTGKGALAGKGCTSRLDFVRYVLIEGLREAARIGVNPYKLGIIASTDAHNANPGDVEEISYDGWAGVEDGTPEQRLAPPTALGSDAASNLISGGGPNPGGLVGVWAEENSRDALFDALQRRETFGTSGPRLQARFFGGWGYPSNLCADAQLLQKAYSGGVPMGGDLPPRPADVAAPAFVVWAQRDPGGPGLRPNPLERIQIIKGWAGSDGEMHQAIHDVAGSDTSASVNLDTCEPVGGGHDQLCAVWRDPEFDPAQHAVYYARVLETPSCRWSRRQCNALRPEQRPATCADPKLHKTVQERAWTSPIWFDPTRQASGS